MERRNWTKEEELILERDGHLGYKHLLTVLDRDYKSIANKVYRGGYIVTHDYKTNCGRKPLNGNTTRKQIVNELKNNKRNDVCKKLNITPRTMNRVMKINPKADIYPVMYWKDEQELEESFNPYYTYEDLSREEKAIYNGLL